jgi:predicted acylesterase/phospholipase RssA
MLPANWKSMHSGCWRPSACRCRACSIRHAAGTGLFKGERIMGVLRQLIGECAIEDLPMSFTAVATDLESGEEVWLREGK